MSIENNSGVRCQGSGVGSQVIFYITDGGRRLAEKLAEGFPGSEVVKFSSKSFGDKWTLSKNIICIMATGIVVRTAAPLLKDKKTDPAVVVLDEKGQYTVSLLSGHVGGANALAEEVAAYLGAQAVITTASDVQGRLSLDLWAVAHNLYIEDFEKLKKLSTRIVNGQKVTFYSDCPIDEGHVPDEFEQADSAEQAEIVVSEGIMNTDALMLRPGVLFVGIGCNRGTEKAEIADVFHGVLQKEGLSINSVKGIASIDVKQDEQGLLDFAEDIGLDIEFFSKDVLNDAVSVYNIAPSEAVRAATGAAAVAEPAAVAGAKKIFDDCTIITPKVKRGNVTLAIAKAKYTL
jgi:cobalamin biosynthesis protein CbiG